MREWKAIFYDRVDGQLKAIEQIFEAKSKAKATQYAKDYAKTMGYRFVEIGV